MKKLLETLLKLFGINLSKVICSMCDAFKSFLSYKKANVQNKIEERKQKEEEKFNDKTDEVTDKGTLEDLLDLKRN